MKKVNVNVEDQNPFIGENVILMNPWDIHDLREGRNDARTWGLLVKIEANGKTIYREARGFNELERNQAQLGYRSSNILKISNNNNTATVKMADWLPYNWYHFDSTVKWAFRISTISLLVTCISSILSLICCLF